MKKYLFLIAIALGVMVATTSCGGDKKTTDEAGSNETTEEVAVAEEVAEPEKIDETINGLEPGAQYQASINGYDYDITLYKDGSSTSRKGGEGSWLIESVHDQPFIVVTLHETHGQIYIDQNHNLHQNNASTTGYKLERINYIPDDAKGMEVGKRYTMPKYRWDKDAFITLNADGTVSSEFNGGELNLSKWKKTTVNGKEWFIIYWDRFDTVNHYDGPSEEREENGGYIVSPSLEYYSMGYDNKNIKFLGGELTFEDNWKDNRQGQLKE